MDLTSVVVRTRGPDQMDCRTTSLTRDHRRGILFTKRRTEMPVKNKMLFFTPELYRRYNSQDENLALAADAEWEAAIVRYHQYLATLPVEMPSPVAELSKLCLHDGEILCRQEQQDPLNNWCFEDRAGARPIRPFGVATLAVRVDDELVTIFYFLCDHMTEQPAAKDWPFSKKHEHWLYDEVHWQQGDRGRFTHLILLSTGVVMTIPFRSVLLSRFRLSPLSAESGKQSA